MSNMTSFSVALLCCLAIPVLLLFAYVYWAKMTRRTLPHWRNALGLISMLVVSSEWLFHTMMWILFSLGIKVGPGAWWTEMYLGIYFIPVGMAATLFLRGLPRLLVITSWLLLLKYFGYFGIA